MISNAAIHLNFIGYFKYALVQVIIFINYSQNYYNIYFRFLIVILINILYVFKVLYFIY